MVPIRRLKVLLLLTEECWARWHIPNEEVDGVAINIYGKQDIQIFESGVAYFK